MDKERRLAALFHPRAPEVWTLACINLAAAAGSLLAIAFPIVANEPRQLALIFALVTGAEAIVIWTVGPRLGPMALQVVTAALTGLISALIVEARSDRYALVAAFGYLWIVVYAAYFFRRWQARLQILLVSVGFGIGLALDHLQTPFIAWLLVTSTAVAIGLVLNNLVEGLHRQAVTDQLTGLLNRHGFLNAASREMALADRVAAPLSLALLDLDAFKVVNDTEGHGAGDRLLANLAKNWTSQIRKSDVLARFGGDEFVLLLPGTTPENAVALLERLRLVHPIKWSAGVAIWWPNESLEHCLARADGCLYRAKTEGRLTVIDTGPVAATAARDKTRSDAPSRTASAAVTERLRQLKSTEQLRH